MKNIYMLLITTKKKDEIAFPMYLWEKDDEDSKSDYPRIILCNKEDNLDILRKSIFLYKKIYIKSTFERK